MQPQVQFTSALQTLQRPINCLSDQDRNIRKNGLSTIKKQISKMSSSNIYKLFTTTNLAKYLLRTMNDKIQANRQLTLDIIQHIINRVKYEQMKKDDLEPIIQHLIQRINKSPFPQPNQDLRQKILNLIKKSIVYKDAIIFNISELANAISKCLDDQSSNLKACSSQLVDQLCREIKGTVGKHSGAIIKSLAVNLNYHKFAIRKITLNTLGKILITESAGGNFQHVQVGLKSALTDPKNDVRKAALECSAHLIKYLAPKYLKIHEAALVSFLLCGLNDENPQNVLRAEKLMIQCGENLKQMEQQQMQEQKIQQSNSMKQQ